MKELLFAVFLMLFTISPGNFLSGDADAYVNLFIRIIASCIAIVGITSKADPILTDATVDEEE